MNLFSFVILFWIAELELIGIMYVPFLVVIYVGVGNFEAILPLAPTLLVSHKVHSIFFHIPAHSLNEFFLELHIFSLR